MLSILISSYQITLLPLKLHLNSDKRLGILRMTGTCFVAYHIIFKYFNHLLSICLSDTLLLDSLRTTLCVRFKSEVVACGVIYAAARRFQVPLPENPPWWEAFDAKKEGIDEVCRVLAHLYSLPKAQYIPVCNDGGSFATSNRSQDLSNQSVPKVNAFLLLKWFVVNFFFFFSIE